MILLMTTVLAFCSIVYELLLGQMLSAYLGNTILRYAITIGLYLFSMGLGAFLFEKVPHHRPVLMLMAVELCLTCIGATSIAWVQLTDTVTFSSTAVSFISHTLILLIGLLTGLELPLLFKIAERKRRLNENLLLGVNYLGAFTGTLLFAFVFYPQLGLLATALCVALLNGLCGISLYFLKSLDPLNESSPTNLPGYLVAAQSGCVLLIVLGLVNQQPLNEWLVQLYYRS
ncbi:MAG: hypothetical protein AAF984_03715 [Verrucomicrobiota bacterium]